MYTHIIKCGLLTIVFTFTSFRQSVVLFNQKCYRLLFRLYY